MNNSRLLLACTLGAFAWPQGADAALLDDFESYLTGSVRDQAPANSVWDTNNSGLPIIVEQSGNKFMAFDWSNSGYRGAHRDLGPGIGASDTSTLFFRFRQNDETGDDAIGVTDLNDPGTATAGFPTFRAGINMVDDGNNSNNTYDLQAGTTTITTGLSEGTWYNAWLVINNASNTMDVYINEGVSKRTTGDKVNGAPVAFINNTSNALDRFLVSGGLGASQRANVDDISLTGGAIQAALFFDDFETYSANSGVTTAGPWAFTGGTTATRTVRDDATDTPFGSNNQYLEMIDANTTDGVRMQSPDFTEVAGAVSTFSFDFYEESGGGDNSMIVGYARNNADLNNAGRRQVIRMSNGTISTLTSVGDDNTYDLDTAYTLYMIFNDSGSAVNYDGGTIAAGDAHIWLEELDSGNFVFVGISGTENAADSAYRVGFRTFTSNIQSLLVDNVELSLGAAAVPEPGSLALLGLGGLLLARRRR